MPSLVTKRGRRRYLGTVWVNGHRGPTRLFPDDTKKSYKAAVEWEAAAAREVRQQQIHAEATATACLTLETWVDDYLDVIMHGYANKTYKEKKAVFERLAAFPGIRSDMPVHEIDRFVCAEFLNVQMLKRSGNAVNKDRKNLGAAWQWGRENMRGWPAGENPGLQGKTRSLLLPKSLRPGSRAMCHRKPTSGRSTIMWPTGHRQPDPQLRFRTASCCWPICTWPPADQSCSRRYGLTWISAGAVSGCGPASARAAAWSMTGCPCQRS